MIQLIEIIMFILSFFPKEHDHEHEHEHNHEQVQEQEQEQEQEIMAGIGLYVFRKIMVMEKLVKVIVGSDTTMINEHYRNLYIEREY